MSGFRCQNLSCQSLLRRQALPIMYFELGSTTLEKSHRTRARSICFPYNFLSFPIEKTLQSDLFLGPRNLISLIDFLPMLRSHQSFLKPSSLSDLFSLSFHYLYQRCDSQEWELIFLSRNLFARCYPIDWNDRCSERIIMHFPAAIK